MKGYVKPELHEVSDMMETVGLLSGLQDGDEISLYWVNHDSGSHSDLWIGIHTKDAGNRSDVIKLELAAYPNRKIKRVNGQGTRADIMPITYKGDGKTLEITCMNFYTNGNENYQISISIEFTDGPFDPLLSDPVVVNRPTGEWGGLGFESGSYCVPIGRIGDSQYHARTGIYYPMDDGNTTGHFDGQGNAKEHWIVR